MLSESLLSKQDTICLLELIHQSLSCSKEEGFRRIINKLCNLISCDFAVCASGKIDNSGNIESYNIINVSYPSEWLDLYTSKDIIRLIQLSENTSPILSYTSGLMLMRFVTFQRAYRSYRRL